MTHAGIVKSFGPQRGWGFIVCSEVAGDIYFQAKELPPDVLTACDTSGFNLQGCTVAFELSHAPDGKPQARSVQLLAVGANSQEQQFDGAVKSFNDSKGFGFLSCSYIEGDIYFKKQDVPTHLHDLNIVGEPVAFTSHVTADGKVQARNLVFSDQAGMRPLNPAGAFAGGVAPGVIMANMGGARSMGSTAGGSSMTGQVKNADRTKGYGFITCPSIPVDIYFKLEEPVQPGQTVSFTLNWTRDCKPQAAAVRPFLQGGEIAVGTIKSYSDKNEYGFISFPDSPQEVYFKRMDLPEGFQAGTSNELIGLTVRCGIKLHKDGKPQAQDMDVVSGPPQGVKRAPAGDDGDGGMTMPAKRQRMSTDGAPQEQSSGQQAQGKIKTYNSVKGFGFIVSDVVPGDIYFKANMLPAHLQDQSTSLIGVQVAFTLNFMRDGKAQAADLQVDPFA